jgi:hypothetical protein
VRRLVRAPVLGAFVETRPPPDQLEAGGDVPPLIRAAHLEIHAHRPVEVLEVGRLDQHVAELGERQAAVQPRRDRVLGEHVRDREVLADVPQPVDQPDLAEPVEVVHHQRAAVAGRRGEVEEALELRRIAATFASSVSRSSRFRSSDGPTGRRSSRSRRRPARPAAAVRWSWSSPKIGTRWPTWSDGPDGSKPL